jgi:predicted regulator of Ras-like GTPase activity (Roadblock/LC7/MglB family)
VRYLEYTLSQNQLDEMELVLQKDFIDVGVHCVVLIDLAGNIIANVDNGNEDYNIYPLAALAAGNYGAISEMAKIVGEEEFSLLFHKGESRNIHFSKIMSDFLLIIIFGKEISLGFLRLKAADATDKIERILTSG